MMKTAKAFIFDLDGTIYLGDNPIPGAVDTLKKLRLTGAKIRFVTNNPRFSRNYYTKKLNNMGVKASVDEVVTSSTLTATYLKNNPSYGKVFIVGENQLKQELIEAEVEVVEEEKADTVLISFDTTLSYKKLQHAFLNIKDGANFIATNPDSVCPTPEGGLIDAGSIIAALESATGKKIEKVIGKPSPVLGKLLLNELDVEPENCVVVGDRVETDIKLGKQAGMKSVWINSYKETDYINLEYKPDFIISSIAELHDVINI